MALLVVLLHIIISTVSIYLVNANTNINGEITRGLPCIKALNQLYCHAGGQAYPETGIDSYIDDNKALMRRMYGNLFQEAPAPEPVAPQRTPASTTAFIRRTVRNFGGARFTRSVHEGFIEDFVEDEFESEGEANLNEDNIWSEILENNYSELFRTFNVTGEEKDVMKELMESAMRAERKEQDLKRRPKRQAGFPGATRRKNRDKIDVCASRVEVTTPYWATNSKGKVRAIVNNKQFEQAVHQEICGVSRTIRCAGDCSCEQKYKWHRLLAYDPNTGDCGGIFMDWFLFPSCCACRCRRNPLLDPAA
jgi:hypothetical protein